MKRIKKIFALVTVVLLILAMAVPVSAAGKISKSKATLVTGQKMQLKLSGTKGKVKWSSSKKSVAAVSSKGLVTAKKKGFATITAKVGKKKYTCKVTVEAPRINKQMITLNVKKSVTLKLTGTKQKIKWSSSNKNVATVNKKGKVTAKNAGSADIIATVGGMKYVCRVIVAGKGTVPVVPVETPVPVRPTEVPVEPTKAPVQPTQAPEPTAIPQPTKAPVQPTEVPKPTSTPVPTATPIPTATPTEVPKPTNTPLPTATPEPTATPTPEISNGFTKLRNYINTYGLVYPSGNTYIKAYKNINTSTCTWEIMYDKETEMLNFELRTSGNKTEDALTVKVGMNAVSANTTYTFLSSQYRSGFKLRTDLDMESYDGNTPIEFNVASTTGTYYTYSEMLTLVNAQLKLGFSGWQNLLMKDADVKLVDLGFIAYEN